MTRHLLQMGVSPNTCTQGAYPGTFHGGFSILMLLARQGKAQLYVLARSKLPANAQYGEKYHRVLGKLSKNALHMALNSNYGGDAVHCRNVPLQDRRDTLKVIIEGGQLHPDNMTLTKGEQQMLAKLQ